MLRIYVLVTLALLVLILDALAFFGSHDGPYPGHRWWVWVSGLVVVLGLYTATKRDHLSSLAYMGTMLILISFVATAFLRVLFENLVAIVPALAGLGVGVGLIAYCFYQRSRPESPEFPNVILRKVLDKKLIHERSAVQVAVSWTLSEEDDLTYLVVYLQNCMDAPRDVTVRIRTLGWWTMPLGLNRPPMRLPWRSTERKVRFPQRSEAVLGPAEVGSLRIPVQGAAGSDWSLNVSTKVSGGGGTRIRHWKAQELSMLFPAWATVWLEMTGGLWVDVPGCSYAAFLPKPTWEVLWQPSISP